MWQRRIKSLHGWLGVIIWPWLIVIALSGLYQNHQGAIDPWLPGDPMTEARLAALPAFPVSAQDATALLGAMEPVTVFGHAGWQAADGSGGIDAVTGARWVTGDYLTRWTGPDGAALGWRMDWQKLFLHLHRAGWASDRLGTWPADLAAGALTLFGISGLWLFLAPRIRRWRQGNPG